MKKRSLKTKLLLYLTVIFVLVGAAGTLINFIIARDMLASLGGNYTSEILRAKVQEFNRVFRRNIDTSAFMAHSPSIIEWLKNEDSQAAKKRALETMRQLKWVLKETDTFLVFSNSRSYYINSIFLSTLSRNIPDHSWYFDTIKNTNYNILIDYNDELQSTKLTVNYPVVDNGKIIGVSGTALDISKMIKLFVSKVSRGAQVILFNQRGIVKAHRNFDYVDNRTIFTLLNNRKEPTMIMKQLQNNSGEIIRTFIDYEGKNLMGTFSYIPSTKWYILVMMDINSLLFSLFIPFIVMLVVTLFLLLVTLLVLINRMVLSPLGIIDSHLSEITNRNFDVSIDVNTDDEFSDVANTINMMAGNIKDYTENLESKVAERTRELKEAFDEVTALKVQQDGDYFLTSLLINPLMTNQAQNERVDVDFFLQQKKEFHFRKRDGEIGGDVCIAHRIHLRGRPYTVFANGDAMGKSLQGAGGALVLGVVFNAFVKRTEVIPTTRNSFPEYWLNAAYNELQNVFISFDGSMLISVVIGMIDEETGMMYYFNAEHPWTVLYRDGKATFTEEELTMRKIGTVGFDDGLKVRTLQLHKGDTVFLGSDGRDDVKLGEDEETGFRIINEDETMFLRCVEEGEGDLEKIVENIRKRGELTDDLSLLKLTYNVDAPLDAKPTDEFYAEKSKGEDLLDKFNAMKKNAANLKEIAEELIQLLKAAATHFTMALAVYKEEECYEKLVSCYSKLNDPQKESETLDEALRYFPMNMEFLYRAALLNRELRNFQLAAVLSERFYQYEPNNLNNLINLSDSYRLCKEPEKAVEYLEMARKIAPNNKNVQKLGNMLKKE